ncbi:MAG: hypothetical protein V1706_01200 [Pseudomonadota bacterium]
MKKIRIYVLLCAFFCQPAPLFAAADHADAPSPDPAPQDQGQPPAIHEDKEKLKKDAQELSRNFRELFKDLSTISLKLAGSMADYMAEWIEKNYEQLTEEKQEKLKQFQEKLQKEYSSTKDMSLQAMEKFLEDFRNLLKQLEQPDEPIPPEKGSDTGERI